MRKRSPGPPEPEGLEARGAWLWQAVLAERPTMNAAQRVLLEEACRMSDRLDRLHRVVGGEHFVEYLSPEDDEQVFVVQVNNAIAEARLTATALRGVVISLGLDATRAANRTGTVAPGESERKGDPIDEIEQHRNRRTAGGPGT